MSLKNNFFAKSNKIRSRGFTLVEVLVALTIAVIGIGGAYALINQSLAFINSASMRLSAVYLAKEGVEIVRNIRDSNYLNAYKNGTGNWNSGLTGCTNGCGADYTMASLSAANKNKFLKFNGSFFNYSSGSDTSYKRVITVNTQTDVLRVNVKVLWSERGAQKSVEIDENLYNWWQM